MCTGNKVKGKEIIINGKNTYKCHICGAETESSIAAITHLLDHGSSALEAINALIKDQETGRVSTEDRASDDRSRARTLINAAVAAIKKGKKSKKRRAVRK